MKEYKKPELEVVYIMFGSEILTLSVNYGELGGEGDQEDIG